MYLLRFNNTKLHKENKDTQSMMPRTQEIKNQIQKQIDQLFLTANCAKNYARFAIFLIIATKRNEFFLCVT